MQFSIFIFAYFHWKYVFLWELMWKYAENAQNHPEYVQNHAKYAKTVQSHTKIFKMMIQTFCEVTACLRRFADLKKTPF